MMTILALFPSLCDANTILLVDTGVGVGVGVTVGVRVGVDVGVRVGV